MMPNIWDRRAQTGLSRQTIHCMWYSSAQNPSSGRTADRQTVDLRRNRLRFVCTGISIDKRNTVIQINVIVF